MACEKIARASVRCPHEQDLNRQQLTALPEVDDGLAAVLRVLNLDSNKLGECTRACW